MSVSHSNEPSHAMGSSIAKSLLDIGAVALRPKQPFTWSSGMQSPIYCDNRLTMSYPVIREQIASGFVQVIQQQFPTVELIAGTATAGIPHAAWVSHQMNLPMIYVRDKAKGHGKENMIEGLLKPSQRVVIIEDLISTGGSSLKVAQAIQQSGGQVLGVVAIFTYQLDDATQAFAQAGIPVYTLATFQDLIEVAYASKQIEQQDLALLKAWRENPKAYRV
jgi:orotate phosphoribosyltransferase